MKKILLFILALCVTGILLPQQSHRFRIQPEHYKMSDSPAIGIEPLKAPAITKSHPMPEMKAPSGERNTDIVTIVDIGTAANSYSFASNIIGSKRSQIWAEPDLNAVTCFHRMGGDLDPDPNANSGDLGYDISYDGGMTWTLMNECYVAVDDQGGDYYTDAARYPNHGIYNPTGNIEDAYVVFFAPNLDGSNGDGVNGLWGGYSFGVDNIGDLSDTTGNYNTQTSQDGIYQYIPNEMDLTSLGQSIIVDINQDWTSGSLVYEGNIILNQGYWNDDEHGFVYEQNLLDFQGWDYFARPWYSSVAFAPDGMTGYVAILSNDGETWAVDGQPSIYPIFWKTTDGGETWDGPHSIQIDGPDGIGGIVDHLLTDDQIAQIYLDPVPARDEIPYTFTTDFDIAVTADGNLHIAGVVAAAGEATDGSISFYVADSLGAVVDLFTDDGGTTWYVEQMGRTLFWDALFGDLDEANRTQITLNPEADKVFISWLDTDKPEAQDNSAPNIFCRGFDPSTYMKTATGNPPVDGPTNVTLFSAGMWQAYFGTAPKTCFEPTEGTYNIPYFYVGMQDPTDATLPVQVKYIQDFSFTDGDFLITGIGDKPVSRVNNFSVSQNYPNPFRGESYMQVNLSEGNNLVLNVYSVTGQNVLSQDYGYYAAGMHTLSINSKDLIPGVYFYEVVAGNNKITHKMVVE